MVPSKIKIESFAKRYHMGTLGGKGLSNCGYLTRWFLGLQCSRSGSGQACSGGSDPRWQAPAVGDRHRVPGQGHRDGGGGLHCRGLGEHEGRWRREEPRGPTLGNWFTLAGAGRG